jgi:hypothetical protein
MRRSAIAVVLALALVGPRPATASDPPVTVASAQIAGDLRVIAIEQRPGGRPVAVIELRGGAKVMLGDGDHLGAATVSCVNVSEATLELIAPVDDPRSIKQWREHSISQWSCVPLAEMGIACGASTPTSLLRVEGDVAVFRVSERDGAAAAVRLRAGASIGGAWRIERVDGSAGRHGVVLVRDATSGRRVSLASWRP